MRAARLLRLLLILQNRGRQTARQLADDLEVAPRTILRDVDAMTEAGLPIVVFQGNRGGIELGFDYRTRLTGLTREEAEALGLILAAGSPMIGALGLGDAAERARSKLVESLPDRTREQCAQAMHRFRVAPASDEHVGDDVRIPALAAAIREARILRLRFATPQERSIRADALEVDPTTGMWRLRDAASGDWIDRADWGRINIAAKP